MKTLTIKMLRDKILRGQPVRVGDVVENVQLIDAKYMINKGFAVEYVAEKPKRKAKKAPVNKMEEPELTR